MDFALSMPPVAERRLGRGTADAADAALAAKRQDRAAAEAATTRAGRGRCRSAVHRVGNDSRCTKIRVGSDSVILSVWRGIQL